MSTTSSTPITWQVTLTPSMAPFAGTHYGPGSTPSVSNATTMSFNSPAWVLRGAGWNDVIQAEQTREFTWRALKS